MGSLSIRLITCVALGVVGCGGDDGGGGPGADAAVPDGGPNGPDAAQPDAEMPDAAVADAGPPGQACGAFEDHITDGLNDISWVFTYAGGFEVREDGDELSNGSIDHVWAFTNDAAGHVLSMVRTDNGV